MSNPKVEHATIVVERTYAAPPHQVFAAWSNREALATWSAPGAATARSATRMAGR
ncbi:hypothetical protein [Ensifer canadensis]